MSHYKMSVKDKNLRQNLQTEQAAFLGKESTIQ